MTLFKGLKKYENVLIPLIFFFLFHKLFYFLGFRNLHIPWGYYQLLDRNALINNPFTSLLLLHSQPPLLNGLLGLILKVSITLNLPEQFAAKSLFLFLGAAATIGFYVTLLLVTDSKILAVIGIIIPLLSPSFYLFENIFFYPFLLYCFFVGLSYFSTKFFIEGNRKYFSLSLFFILLICNTRSMFHVLWGVTLLFILINFSFYSGRKIKKYHLIAGLVFIMLLSVWPLKNKIFFKQFSSSTWTGFNLAKNFIDLKGSEMDNYLEKGIVPDDVSESLKNFQRKYSFSDEEIEVIALTEKEAGTRNWNHFIFTTINQELQKNAFRKRMENPKKWFSRSVYYYFAWSRPSFIHPYTNNIRGPENIMYQLYADSIQKLVFYDLRHTVETIIPKADHIFEWSQIPFSFFGLVLFPGLILSAIILVFYTFRLRQKEIFSVLIFSLINIFWVLFIPVLSDGMEGNRMRFAIFPLLMVLSLVGVNFILGSGQKRICDHVD